MQFIHRLHAVWPWLPAFRAVAETQHLPTAARELGLAPSSLSRSIKQLEQILGVSLFGHHKKALVLNDVGHSLLSAVRQAMRLLDDAVRAVAGDEMAGTATAVLARHLPSELLALACAGLAQRQPQLQISTLSASDDAIDGLLLSGSADVAVVSSSARHPELTVDHLVTRTRRVFRSASMAARGSPLPFVVVGERNRPVADGWPITEPRDIKVWVHDERAALEISRNSDLVCIASEHAAALHGTDLVSLPHQLPELTLYLVTRRTLGTHQRTVVLSDSIRDAMCAAVPAATNSLVV